MRSPRRALGLVARWLAGTGLVTWRYLWETTPLHRGEHEGDDGDRPPDVAGVGDELLVEMPGPWNGPVRIALRDATTVRLVTLRGHLEAGQVQFQAHEDGDLLVFEIQLWARAATRLVHLLYSHLRLAKEVQLNMWVRFCQAAVATSGGRLTGGVHITTRRLAENVPATAG